MVDRTARQWRALAKQRMALAKLDDEVCCRCGRAIDYDLDTRTRLGPTIDHLDPIGFGGDLITTLDNLKPAHRRCNSRHGQAVGAALIRARKAGHPVAGPVLAAERRGAPPPTPRTKKHLSVVSGQKSDFSSGTADNPATALNSHPTDRSGELVSGAPDPAGDPFALASPPRLFSEPRPDAVGSLGPTWSSWIGENLLHPRTRGPLRLNAAQRLVLDRALEVDSSGRLVWSEVLVSAPRQVMKSVLLYAVAAARAAHAAQFGEQQTVLHTANRLVAARRVHAMAWPWAERQGLHVSKALDTAAITWPDGSSWQVSSLSAAWGVTATAVMADEIWNVPPEVVEDALLPTLVSVDQSQLWLLSCANAEATATYARAAGERSYPAVRPWSLSGRRRLMRTVPTRQCGVPPHRFGPRSVNA